MGKVKKRQAPEVEPPPQDSSSDSDDEPIPKKAKTKAPPKKTKPNPKYDLDDDEDDDIIDETDFWPRPDLTKLFIRMEKVLPDKDKHKFESAAEKLDWEQICFDNYSAEECKSMWQKVSLRQRRYRLLKELLDDAKIWVDQPWTNFYRSQKTNRHPDMPKRPLSTYMMFYMEKKDRVAKEYPNLEMTKLSTIIAAMYKNLPDKQKQKYVDKAKVQRDEYNKKMLTFYANHPDLKPPKTKRSKAAKEQPGPKKPQTPSQLYLKDKMDKHKTEPEEQRQQWMEHYKEAWKELSEKKRVTWINRALEDEDRYARELVRYKEDHPDFAEPTMKSVLNKDEKAIYDKSVGKPDKPPNSGYSLFSRIMLSSEEIKHINHKDRMTQISSMWKNLSAKDKRKYGDKVQQMLEQYKLDFATYLESLPPEKREEELQNNMVRRKQEPLAGRPKKKVPEKSKSLKPGERPGMANPFNDGIELFKGEPEAPPSTPFKLFLKDFLVTAKHISTETNRLKEAPAHWNKLADSEKARWRKRLQEQKQKYINQYENFLKSLTQEQLKEYSILKAKNNERREQADSAKSDEDEEDDDDDSTESSDSSSNSGNESDTEDESSSSGEESE